MNTIFPFTFIAAPNASVPGFSSKCNNAQATRQHNCELEAKTEHGSRSFSIYLVVRENLLHLFIHCDCNSKFHGILSLSLARACFVHSHCL